MTQEVKLAFRWCRKCVDFEDCYADSDIPRLLELDCAKGAIPFDDCASPCIWKYEDIYECWETSCDGAFVLCDGTPSDNSMRFCPYCGKLIKTLDK